MNLADRRSPSGPRVDIQLPYYGATGVDGTTPGTYFATVFASAAIDAAGVEDATAYLIPQRGTLGTFLVQNVALGADAVNLTYQVRRNGIAVGSPVIIGNNAVGPVRSDLSTIGVSAGDTVGIAITVPAFPGAPPAPKIVFTWFPSQN